MQMRLITKWCTTNKTSIEAYIGKIGFFYVDCSFKHSHMGCGVHAPNGMTKLKKDNDLAYLIQTSKVFYPNGFKDAWNN